MITGDTAERNRLRISEIFYSLQGETRFSGLPTLFIRLTGCPLRCGYCDTSYAFQGGQWMTLEQILSRVTEIGAHYVTVTGGEPLAQKPCATLIRALCDQGLQVSVETSGAVPIAGLDPRAVVIMDIKTPGSGEDERNLPENLAAIKAGDEIKFVITDRRDYEWARDQLWDQALHQRCQVLFSPAAPTLPPRELAEWILQDKLPVRFGLQLHKILWGDEPGH